MNHLHSKRLNIVHGQERSGKWTVVVSASRRADNDQMKHLKKYRKAHLDEKNFNQIQAHLKPLSDKDILQQQQMPGVPPGPISARI